MINIGYPFDRGYLDPASQSLRVGGKGREREQVLRNSSEVIFITLDYAFHQDLSRRKDSEIQNACLIVIFIDF